MVLLHYFRRIYPVDIRIQAQFSTGMLRLALVVRFRAIFFFCCHESLPIECNPLNLQSPSPIKVVAKFYGFGASDIQNIAFRSNIPLSFSIVTGRFPCFDHLKGGNVAALQPHRQPLTPFQKRSFKENAAFCSVTCCCFWFKRMQLHTVVVLLRQFISVNCIWCSDCIVSHVFLINYFCFIILAIHIDAISGTRILFHRTLSETEWQTLVMTFRNRTTPRQFL